MTPDIAPATSARPKADFYVIGNGHYVLDAENGRCYLESSQVRRDRNGELRCTLSVRTALVGAMTLADDGTIAHFDAVNLSSPQQRRTLALDLARRARTESADVDWHAQLDDLAFRVGKAETVGDPAEWLADIQRAEVQPIHTVEGVPLLANHPQILFGDGDSLKSYLALWMAGQLVMQGVRVMYCDWELDGGDHRERAAALWGDRVPQLLYVRCQRPLVHEVDRLARLVHQHHLQFAVLDSVAFACHAKPEEAQTAQEYFRALRGLGIGTLNLAHTTKAAIEQGEHRPFGSAFWHNGARSTWFAKAEDDAAEGARTVVLQHRKSNLGPRRPALAYRFDFTDGRTVVRRVEAASVETLAHTLPAWQRIKAALKSGPLTMAELAEEIGAKEDTTRRTVSRYDRLFTVIESSNGAKRVALLERRAS